MKTKKLVIFLGMLVFLIGSLGFVYCDELGGETTKILDIGEIIGVGVEKIFGFGIDYDEELIKDFETENSLNINDDEFENIVPESASGHPTYIRLKEGNIESADITISEEGTYTFNGKSTPFSVPAGSRIIFMDNEITIEFPDDGEIKEFSDLNLEETYLTKIKGENVKLPGEHSLDGGDLYYNGKLFVKAGDEVIIDKIEFTELEKDVNLYFEKDFNPANHKDENYFNYGEDKISLGGYAFTADLGTENNVFGDMETKKYIDGQKDPKTRNLEITLNGGVVEIEKDSSKDYLAFKAQANGDYVIYDGRTIIEGDYSERGLVKKDGKTTISDQSKIFVKASEDKEGQLYSYDLNLNEGEYVLENNIFKDKKGNELFNANKPWENVIRKSQNLVINPEKRYPTLTEEGKKIYDKVEEETGARPRFYGLVNQENEENLAKLPCKVVEIVNQNTLNTKIGVEELHHVFNLEMGGLEAFQEAIKADPGREILGISIGLDTFGGVDHSFEKSKGFFPPDFNPSELETFEWENEKDEIVTSVVFENIEQAYTALAGEYAYRKYQSIKLYEKYYGEEEKNKLTKDQEILLAYYNYNCGIGCLESALKNKNAEDKIFKAWDKEDDSSYINNPRLNNHRLLASIKFSQESGIFSSP